MFSSENLKRRDLGIDAIMTLKYMLKK